VDLKNVPGAKARAAPVNSRSHDRFVARVESHERAPARDGCQQRVAHDAVQHSHRDWDEELLKLFGVRARFLRRARVERSVWRVQPVGRRNSIAASQAISSGVVRQVCTQPGMVKTLRHGCFMLMHTGAKPIASKNNLLTRSRGYRRTRICARGQHLHRGRVVQWSRWTRADQDRRRIESLAAQVATPRRVSRAGFAGSARRTGINMRAVCSPPHARHNSAHLARAALEGIAYQVHDVLHAMQSDSGIKLKELRSTRRVRNNLLMQFQADLLACRSCAARNETTPSAPPISPASPSATGKTNPRCAQWQADVASRQR